MTTRYSEGSGAGEVAAASGWMGPWIAFAALALWTASPGQASLLLAAAGIVSAFLWGSKGRGRSWGWGTVLLLVSILVAFGAHRQVTSIADDFDAYWLERVTDVETRLDDLLGRRLEAGEAAADSLSRLSAVLARPESSVEPLRRIRSNFGITALALFDADGRLLVWDGLHHGKLPEEVISGASRYFVQDLPLFGYLYVTAVGDDGTVAVGAQLMRTDLPADLGAQLGDFASEFEAEVGEPVFISGEPPVRVGGTWSLTLPSGEELLSIVVERPDPSSRVVEVMEGWRALVAVLLFVTWLLVAAGGPPRLAGATMAAGGLLFLAAFLPVQLVPALSTLFSPIDYQVPGPLPVSLGRLALLAVTGFTAVAVLPRPRLEWPPWLAGMTTGLAFPLTIAWAGRGIRSTSFGSDRLDWVVYTVALAALLSLLAGSAVAFAKPRVGARRSYALIALVVGGVLGATGAAFVGLAATLPGWWTALWAIPIALTAASMGAWRSWERSLVGWTVSIVLASSAALPSAWLDRIDTQLLAGSERLAALADPIDPALERDLTRLGELADSLDRAGQRDLDIVYGAWRKSGLAEQATPLDLAVWSGEGDVLDAIRIGVSRERPRVLEERLTQARLEGRLVVQPERRDDARYIMAVPLSAGRSLTAIAPPIPALGARSPLSAIFQRESAAQRAPLTLIQRLPGDPLGGDALNWTRTGTGWQGEIGLQFANATYHAHHAVELPGPLLASARGALLLVLNVLVFAAFWLLGRALLRDAVPPEMRLSGLVISFRARVTLALFGFFVLANAVFGTVAYRTLDRASSRSAQVIAERIIEDAAVRYVTLRAENERTGVTGGVIERLAERVGTELLEFRGGALREGSIEELVELGLYEGWMPLEHERLLDGREGSEGFSQTALGGWAYVTAYRRLPDGDILGVQVPLQAGDTQIQTTDLVELLGFAILVGAALSLVLAWLAGRALTSPIRALQAASEAVGAGDLNLQLPDARLDEFGSVFRAFNRMVGRVRRARRQLVRTSRRTQAIMDEAAVGMVALDPAGLVTVVNPRAEELLGCEVLLGRSVPGEGPLGEILSGWLATFLDGSADEADAELSAGDRRVRIRARRLGTMGTRRGVVVSMDDVTDQLRTERVLAWGEMARQVAHEVKNPLTPIKLSVQHVLRAWEDGRPDFDQILTKNSTAMLREIDRLAGIAQSFSRFGAPGGASDAPLSEVSVPEVVAELLQLYGGEASGSARFEAEVPADLPHVIARGPELKEVLVNLLENARVAIGDEGLVQIVGRTEGAGHVVVEVVDDGAGIADEFQPRIFEPQFSTRSTGAGLGLAIVQRLVRAWGGEVSVESIVGKGTTMRVKLRTWPVAGAGEGGFGGAEGTS